MSGPPLAFLSYVRFEDEHETGRLTQLRERLSGEVRMQAGEAFEIFQDRQDIAWGQQWRQRIEESLEAVTFLIPILTPGFFRSAACRAELERFLAHEERLGRNDLVLPVLYVNTPVLADDAKRRADPLATNLAARQFLDWRELRFEPWTSPSVGRVVAQMAGQIVAALERYAAGAKSGPAASLQSNGQGKSESRAVISQVETSRAFAAKKEPPTLIVDAFHRGDFSTLRDAIKAAAPGSRLIIRQGIYKEGLLVDKPLEIVGEGDLGDVVIEATGSHVMFFQTNMARLVNLTLRQRGGGGWVGLNISQGRVEVEGCDITSQGSSCIAIHGGAEPRLRHNRVHDGKGAGVVFYAGGQGHLEDNEIFANAFAGIEIYDDSNPTLRRNRIHDGGAAGILVHSGGRGLFEENEIFANQHAGIAIRDRSHPIVRRNRIHDGKESGIFVYEHGNGIVDENEIFGNALAGLASESGAKPTVLRNRIRSNGTVGISIGSGGEGVFEDNDLRDNTQGAWSIDPECEFKVRREGNLE